MEKRSIERETSGNGPRCVSPRLCQPWHPESRSNYDTCSGGRPCHELPPRQHGTFPKMGVTNILTGRWRFPGIRGNYVFDTQLRLLSRYGYEIRTKRSTTLQSESVEHAPALVRVIKQKNQVFNERGEFSFTFNLNSHEPLVEYVYPLLATEGLSLEQARYQRIDGNTVVRDILRRTTEKVAECATGEYR